MANKHCEVKGCKCEHQAAKNEKTRAAAVAAIEKEQAANAKMLAAIEEKMAAVEGRMAAMESKRLSVLLEAVIQENEGVQESEFAGLYGMNEWGATGTAIRLLDAHCLGKEARLHMWDMSKLCVFDDAKAKSEIACLYKFARAVVIQVEKAMIAKGWDRRATDETRITVVGRAMTAVWTPKAPTTLTGSMAAMTLN